MTPFEALETNLFAQVGNHLGDTISVVLNDGTAHDIIGFVSMNADGLGTTGIDPIRQLSHVKIDKTPTNVALMPNGPSDIKRLTGRKLPGTFKPAADTIDDDGMSWLFDVQKARP